MSQESARTGLAKAKWARHPGDRWWHSIGGTHAGSVLTRCNGRWPIGDLDVEIDPSPPHDERCDACQHAAIEAIRVELGLAELEQVGAQLEQITAELDAVRIDRSHWRETALNLRRRVEELAAQVEAMR